MIRRIDWYFDFISPYAYLQSRRLGELERRGAVDARPLVLAGLLNHWGHVGPAELAPKRRWTFEQCAWLAHQHGIPMKAPPRHPFNSVPLLRLALACGEEGHAPVPVVEALFAFIWRDGGNPEDPRAIAALATSLDIAPERIEDPAIKAALRANGDRAIAQGVFGVPSVVFDDKVFWGFEATAMTLACLDGDPFFASDAFTTANDIPMGLTRPRPQPAGGNG